MSQFTPLSAEKERERESFRQFFQKQLGAGVLLVKWRPPLQGIECGAGTESDDATAAEPPPIVCSHDKCSSLLLSPYHRYII